MIQDGTDSGSGSGLPDFLAQHRTAILQLAVKHGAHNVRVFGSVARGDTHTESDVDFLVDLAEGRDLFDLGALLMDLRDLLHHPVDIVTTKSLHHRLRDSVLKEAVSL